MANPVSQKEKDQAQKAYDNGMFDTLVKQIDAEYNLAYIHQFDKIQQGLSRLKLYNNQKRDLDLVGDPLLFTVHQTLLASFYEDELSVIFEGREDGDEETAENLTAMAKFDYEKMGKDVLDYQWIWDALFSGRGLLLNMEFDRDPEFMCPTPEIIDPTTFLRDPRATSVNGDSKGRGGMRFGGREVMINRANLLPKYGYFNISNLRSENEIRSLLKQAEQARDQAQNLQTLINKNMESSLGDNGAIAGLQWFTYWKGKRAMAILAQDRTRIIKYFELPNQRRYPINDRPLYPNSHDWAGTSVPDLVEDKQRQRSVALNLGLQVMKADLYPMFLYDEDRIKDKGDLLKFGFNKFVGVQNNDGKDIRGAVQPLNKPTVAMEMVDFILNSLDASAQRSTATPDMQQGQIAEQRRTLGELNLVASKVDTRYSLTAKVFGWSERDFWRDWYQLYKEYFAGGIDKKIIRIKGSLGSKWRPLLKDNITARLDPDVTIESKIVSDAEQTRERILLQGFGNALILDPNANKRYYLRKLAKLNGYTSDEIELLLPPTIEELNAEDENDSLNKNVLVSVHPLDDHMAHLEIHQKADETAAKAAHIHAHKLAMMIKRNQPDLFPQPQDPNNPAADQPGNPGIPPKAPINTVLPSGALASPSQAANPSANPLS